MDVKTENGERGLANLTKPIMVSLFFIALMTVSCITQAGPVPVKSWTKYTPPQVRDTLGTFSLPHDGYVDFHIIFTPAAPGASNRNQRIAGLPDFTANVYGDPSYVAYINVNDVPLAGATTYEMMTYDPGGRPIVEGTFNIDISYTPFTVNDSTDLELNDSRETASTPALSGTTVKVTGVTNKRFRILMT